MPGGLRGQSMATQTDLSATTVSGADAGAGAAIDPVTVEVIRGGMETVAYEMATHVSLTATTPILNQ